MLEQLMQTIQVRLPGRCCVWSETPLSLTSSVFGAASSLVKAIQGAYGQTDRLTDRFSLSLARAPNKKNTHTHTGPAGPSGKRGICGV